MFFPCLAVGLLIVYGFVLFKLCKVMGCFYCLFMFLYACFMSERLYRGLLSIQIRDMSEEGHIVHAYNRKTVQHKYTKKEKKC